MLRRMLLASGISYLSRNVSCWTTANRDKCGELAGSRICNSIKWDEGIWCANSVALKRAVHRGETFLKNHILYPNSVMCLNIF